MNVPKVLMSLAIVLLVLALVLPARGQTSSIIVDNADSILDVPLTISLSLLGSTADVEPRFVVQYANTIRHYDLEVIPTSLQTRLKHLSDRIIFQYANSNREFQLVYPIALINDTTTPQINGVIASVTGCDSVIIAWTTDELADSEVVFGDQSGQYTQTVSDPLYARHHEITLTGLVPGTYYSNPK